MQPTATDINHERIPYKLNVFLFGHNDNESQSVKQFQKYKHKPIKNNFSIDGDSDDDEDLILSGKNCLLCVCQWILTLLDLFLY